MLRVKICGITRAEDARLACKLGADAIGFIFYDKSPRCVTLAQAADIAAGLPEHVARVGVFVNTPPAEILRYIKNVGLTAVQLHGDYPLEAFEHFAADQVIAVARVGEDFRSEDLARFTDQAAAILLDTQKKGLYGGTSETFDWQAALAAKAYGRLIVAGGLTPDNVRTAVETVAPYALDVSSGVEAEPGRKHPDKLRRLFANLQAYRQHWQPVSRRRFPLA
jgi:phosphoribosylanthranilate isomerase